MDDWDFESALQGDGNELSEISSQQTVGVQSLSNVDIGTSSVSNGLTERDVSRH